MLSKVSNEVGLNYFQRVDIGARWKVKYAAVIRPVLTTRARGAYAMLELMQLSVITPPAITDVAKRRKLAPDNR